LNDNSVTPTRLSRVFHPLFSHRPPLFDPEGRTPDPPSVSRKEGGQTFGADQPGDNACLLSHISSHALLRKTTLTPPPAPGHPSQEEKRYVVCLDTGELLEEIETDPCSYREILYSKPKPCDSQYWLQLYDRDLKIKRPYLTAKQKNKGPRGKIFEFSDASGRRLEFTARNSGHKIRSQYCCTFHNSWPMDGKSLKKMLDKFLQRLRRKFPGLHYLWVLEFQEREAPHIHLFTDIPPNRKNRWFLADAWLESSGQTDDPKCRRFHRSPKNFFKWEMTNGQYLSKNYIGKPEQKDVPASFHDVGRFWGASQNMTPDYATVNPLDEPLAAKIAIGQAARIVTKLQERKIDGYKSFAHLYKKTIALFGVDESEIDGKIKKAIRQGIKHKGTHLTTRFKRPTNLRNKKKTVTLAGRSFDFYQVLAFLTNTPSASGFKAFSTWADSLPPPRPAGFTAHLTWDHLTPPPAPSQIPF
jgi:hypothetical protein